MRGLIFNLLADLARDAGCEEDAWTVALAVSEEMACELSRDAVELEVAPGLVAEVSLQGAADFTFKWLLRTAPPFCDDEWADVLGTPLEAPDGVASMLASFDALGRRGPNRD